MPELEFIKKNIYGRYLYFPQNDLAKKALEALSPNKKSFTAKEVNFFKDLASVKLVAEDEIT